MGENYFRHDPVKKLDLIDLTSALVSLTSHLQELGMVINEDKTVVMFIKPRSSPDSQHTICVHGRSLTEVSSTRCLGIIIDNRLSFSDQCNKLVAKVSRKIGALRRSFRQLSLKARRLYVLCVIQPDLEFAFQSYLPSLSVSDRERLFSLHRSAVRAAFGAHYQEDITPLLKSLNLSTLKQRYVELFARFVFHCKTNTTVKCLSSLFPAISHPQHTTRGVSFSNIRLSRYNSSSGYRSFSSRAALVWNFLPSPMKTCKFPGTFSALLRDLLKDESQFVRLQQLLFDNVFNV